MSGERREKQILALAAADPSLSHKQLAELTQCSTKTIQRALKRNAPTLDEIDSKLRAVQARIQEVLPAEKRVDAYVEMLNVAKVTKQPSAGAAILTRLDDLDGIITDKERLRTRSGEQPANQPMFVFQAGAKIDFGGLTVQRTDTPYIDVAPEKGVSDNGHVADSE